MSLSGAELRRRRPLWVALSELFLDQETDEYTLRHIARIVAASGYSDQEVRDIYWHEVAPLLAGNMLVVAGVWDGFDKDWLCAQAARNAARRPRFSLSRWIVRRAITEELKRVLAAAEAQDTSEGTQPNEQTL